MFDSDFDYGEYIPSISPIGALPEDLNDSNSYDPQYITDADAYVNTIDPEDMIDMDAYDYANDPDYQKFV